MKIIRQGTKVKIAPSFSSQKGHELYEYTKEVVNNTAQIVRVNSSGPFPVNALSKKRSLSSLVKYVRLKIDKEANFPICE